MSEVQCVHLSQLTEKTNVGTKAQNLHQLMKLGYRVPETIVIPYESFKACKSDSKTGFACIEKLLESIIDEGKYVPPRMWKTLLSFHLQASLKRTCISRGLPP